MAVPVIILMGVIIASAISAPQVKKNSDVIALRSPANMSYEELEYILRSKRGESSIPPKRLSPCARAILGCCRDKVMNGDCSESLNCGAFFFDDNPCEEKFVIDALNAAKSFYKQLNDIK